jgi:hypothetical protein
MFRLLALTLLLATGCDGGGDSEKDGPTMPGSDTGSEGCSGVEPIATELIIGNGGMGEFEGVEWPTILLRLLAEDEDGDLDLAFMEFWWDLEEDGTVDTGVSGNDRYFTLESDECSTQSIDLGLKLQVGTQLAYNTHYEFAAQVTDRAGLTSNLVVAAGPTPNSDGTDGDGTGN